MVDEALPKSAPARGSSKRNRAAEVHNLSEKVTSLAEEGVFVLMGFLGSLGGFFMDFIDLWVLIFE